MGFTLHRGFESRPLRSHAWRGAESLGTEGHARGEPSAGLAAITHMDESEMLSAVRRLRGAGASRRDIARSLGVKPSVVAPLVRKVGAETAGHDVGALVGCWVSPGWSTELLVARREGWDDVDLGPDGPTGVALTLVARAERHDGVSVCG